MIRKRLGVLVIGQTPRADLTAPLHRLAQACDLHVRGALDGLAAAELPDAAAAAYPLVTRLRDGTRVTVDEGFLTPLLQATLDELEREAVVASVLLCAGPFRGLTSTRPLIRPFQLAAQTLRSLGHARLGVVVPVEGQRAPAERKWREAGLTPVIWAMDARPPAQALEHWLAARTAEAAGVSALVFDYVGYPREAVQRVRAEVGLPVMDLGHLAVAALEAMVLEEA